MNKKLLAVALATAFAAPAMADGVQIYGAFDVGVLGRNGDWQVASGLNGHNGIGFRMSEDLGNGMKISGDAMFGFALDAGGNSLGLGSGRSTTYTDSNGDTVTVNDGNQGGFSTIYSYLALSGDFGTVIAGRAGGARAGFIKKYDPFGGFGVGGALAAYGGASGNADYADNVLAWVTPEIVPGFKVLAAYTSNLVGQDFSPRRGNDTATPLYAIAGLYAAGPVDVTVAYESLTLDNAGTNHRNVWTGAASYDFGVAKLMGLYANVEGLDHGWQIGATVPVGEATTLKAGYVTTRNTGSAVAGARECTKYALGVNHDLSKRTRLYADVARLADDDAASSCAAGIRTYGGDYANGGAGRDNNNAFGTWGMNVGVRHSF